MAKGKRAAALFEVIQASKQKEQLRAAGGGFLTPSWWFKGKARNNSAGESAPAASSPRMEAPLKHETPSKRVLPASPAPIVPEVSEAAPVAESTSSAETASVESASVESGESESEAHVGETDESLSATFTPEPPRPPVHHEFVDNEEPALEDPKPAPVMKPVVGSSRSVKTPVRKPVDVDVDRGKQQIVLRLSFTSAAISTFGLIVVVALAVLIGKSISHGPSQAGANSIAEVKSGKVSPGVMTVFQGRGEEPPINVQPAPKPVPQPAPRQTAQPKNGAAKSTEAPKEAQPVAAKPSQTPGLNSAGKRIIGEQYVLIQSYPDPEDANDARDALIKAGIACTCEKGTRWAPAWTSVIGTRGFDHTRSNPEFDAYMKAINQVSATFAGPSKFRRFEPHVIGWKE